MSKNKSINKPSDNNVVENETVLAGSIVDDPVAPEIKKTVQQADAVPSDTQQPISGRACFAVNRIDIGVTIETVFLADSGEIMRLPAVFPNRAYAHEQIQALMQLVDSNFDEFERQSSWFTATPSV